MKKTILVDARVLSMNFCGIGVFCYNVIKAFSKYASNIELLVCSNQAINSNYEDIYKMKNIKVVIAPLPFLSHRGILWFLFKLPVLIYKYKPYFYWSPAVLLPLCGLKNVRKIITIHDVVLQEYSKTMNLRNWLVNKVLTNRSIKQADYIWTVSNYTKEKVLQYYPNIINTKFFVGSSINMDFYYPLNISTERRHIYLDKFGYTPETKYLLFVGTLEPRKNLKFLLSLMPFLSKQNYKLIIVGGKGWGKTDIARIINQEDFPKEDVFFTGYISNEELRLLYNIVDCFVSTSINEGFGLPQLEAMACNCPVVSANNSAMIEVVGGAGVLVDGWDVNEWCNKIVWSVNNKKEILKKYPLKIQQYKWEMIIKRLENDIIYNEK